MASCLARSFAVHKSFLFTSRTSSVNFFSSLSPVYEKVSSSDWSSNRFAYNKLNEPKHVRCRYFSLDGLHSLYDAISNSDQSHAFKHLLIQTHDLTSMPWWGTIISASLALKLFVSLPCGVYQQHILSKIELTKIELDATVEGLKEKVLLEARKGRWTKEKAKSKLHSEIRKQWKILIVKNNCHPFKNFILFLAQFPFWLLMTLTIRKLAVDVAAMNLEYVVPELQFLVGGPVWCQNLAAPDSTFILPALNALTILTLNEISVLQSDLKAGKNKQKSLLKKIIQNFLRLLAVAVFFISAASPSGMSLFWTTSSVIALMQNLLLMSPRVRRLLRVPPTPSDLTKPYSQMWSAFAAKCQKLLSRK